MNIRANFGPPALLVALAATLTVVAPTPGPEVPRQHASTSYPGLSVTSSHQSRIVDGTKPRPTDFSVHALALDERTLLMPSESWPYAADDKQVFRSEDRGVTWTQIRALHGQHIAGLTRAPDGRLIGLATDPSGEPRSISSEDAGVHWVVRPMTFPRRLDIPYRLTFSDASTGYAAPSEGDVLLQTTDGGSNWSEVALRGSPTGSVAIAPDGRPVVTVARDGECRGALVTTQGSGWVRVPGTCIDEPMWSVGISQEGWGLAMGGAREYLGTYGSTIVLTTQQDGIWHTDAQQEGPPLVGDIALRGDRSGYTKDFGWRYRTTDRGITWSPETFWGPAHVDPSGSLVLAATEGEGYRVSADGGATWIRYPDLSGLEIAVEGDDLHSGPTTFDRRAGAWVGRSAPTQSAAGQEVLYQKGGLILTRDRVSHDAGKTWSDVSWGSEPPPFDVTFSDARHGYGIAVAAGDSAHLGHLLLLRTEDGGVTWTKSEFPHHLHSTKISASGSTVAMMGNVQLAGDTGKGHWRGRLLAISTDYGSTWTTWEDDLDATCDSMSVGAGSIWLGCSYGLGGGMVLTSVDYGKSWRLNHTEVRIESIVAVDERKAFASGDGGVLETTDGGKSWTVLTPLSSLSR